MDISLTDSIAILIAAVPLFLLILWITFFLLFLLVDYCKLYLYTSVFDSLYFLICGCSPQHRYDIDREIYKRQLNIEKRLAIDKSILEGTVRILLFSDVDIYTPFTDTGNACHDIISKGDHNLKNVTNMSLLSSYNSETERYNSQSLFNTLKLKYGPDFTNSERKCYADHRVLHIVLLFQKVLHEIVESNANFEKESNESIAKWLIELPSYGNTPTEGEILFHNLNSVWNDSVFQKFYLQEKEKGMSNSLDFIFEKQQLNRMVRKDFLPTNQDIEKMHIVTAHDQSLKVMKVVMNLSKTRKIKITKFSMKFLKLKCKLGSKIISDYCDFAIFIGRQENGYFLIQNSIPNSSVINISNDKNSHLNGLLPNIICLDERLLSVDKFQDCFTNLNVRNDMIDFKCEVVSKIASLPSVVFNSLNPQPFMSTTLPSNSKN